MAGEYDPRPQHNLKSVLEPKQELGEKPTIQAVEFDSLLAGLDLTPEELGLDRNIEDVVVPPEYFSAAEVAGDLIKKQRFSDSYTFTEADSQRLQKLEDLSDEFYKNAQAQQKKVGGLLSDRIKSLKDQKSALSSGDNVDSDKVNQINNQITKLEVSGEKAKFRVDKHEVFLKNVRKLRTENERRLKGGTPEKVPEVAAVKKEMSTDFNGEQYEEELIAGIPAFADIRRLATATGYTESKIILRSDYADESVISKPMSPDDRKRGINQTLSTVENDIKKLELLVASLQDEKFMFKFLSGSQKEDKKQYVQLFLLPKLATFRTALEEKRKIFQTAKDKLMITDWTREGQPEFIALQGVLNRARSSETSTYTSLNQFLSLRKELVDARNNASTDAVRSALKKKNVSDESIDGVIANLEKNVLTDVDAVLTDLDKRTLRFWTETHLRDKSQAPEYVRLNEALAAGLSILNNSSADLIARRDQIAATRTAMEGKKNSYIDVFPNGTALASGADIFLQKKIDESLARESFLLELAKKQVDGELRKHPLLKSIMDAIKDASDATKSYEDREQAISDAKTELGKNKNDVKKAFSVDLQDQVEADLIKIEAEADKEKSRLEQERTAAAEMGVNLKKRKLLDLITFILKKPKSDEWGKTESAIVLDQLLVDLNQAQIDARDAGNTLATSGEKADFDDAKKKLEETIKTAERLDPKHREKLWKKIQSQLDLTNALKNKEDVDELNASLEMMPEPQKTKEKEKWRLLFELWNGYFKGSISNDSELRLLWVDPAASREAIKPYCKIETVRKFIAMPEVSPIVNLLESYYAGVTTYSSINKDGQVVQIEWDYAAKGDPQQDDVDKGVKKITDLLKEDVENGKANVNGLDLSHTPDSVLSGVHHAQMVGELRFKYFARRYANYLASPQNFKIEPITDVNPLAGILYTLRSKGKISQDTLLMWKILRMPKNQRGMYQLLATNKALDKHGAIVKVSTNRDGSVEYLPEDATPKGHGEFYKDNPEEAVRNDSVYKAMELRTFLDQGMTFYDNQLGYVNIDYNDMDIDDDLNILPYMWEAAKDNTYSGLTYEGYIGMCKVWNEFVSEAQKPPTLHEASDVAKLIKNLGGKLSPFKDGYNQLKGDEKNRIKAIIDQIFLRYTKGLFDEYNGAVAGGLGGTIAGVASGEGSTVKQRFLRKAIEAFEAMQTVPGEIREGIIEILKEYEKKPTLDDLFAERQGHPLPPKIGFFESEERLRRKAIINGLLEGLTESEKKDTKGSTH